MKIKIIKGIDKNEDKFSFKNNELNSKIIRIFNPSGEMTDLEMEGEVLFTSNLKAEKKQNYKNLRFIEENEEKNLETNESYYNLGINEYKMNVTSNMKLIETKNEPKTLEKLINLTHIINLIIYENVTLNNNLTIEEGIETEENNTNQSLNGINSTNFARNLEINNINFPHSYNSRYKFFSTNFLGLKLSLEQHLNINNKTYLREGYVNLFLGASEKIISKIEKYHYPNIPNGISSKSIFDKYYNIYKSFKPFGFCISGNLKLKVYINHGINFGVSDEEMYTKYFTNFEIGIIGSFGPNFKIVSFGVEVTGGIAKGNSYIQANTLMKSNPSLTKFIFYKNIYACSIDISFYFSIWLLFWEKTFKTTMNIFKGIPSYEYYYGLY